MSLEIETMYDSFLSQLKEKLGPVDPVFATRLMYLERKLAKAYPTSMKPHTSLTITYKTGINRDSKRVDLQSRGGLMVELLDTPNDILCMGYMGIQEVAGLATDPDIEKITGKASPILRG